MKCRRIPLIIMLISLLFGGFPSFSQTAEELLPKAIQLEEVKGELEKALEIYQTIVREYPDNRPVAAKAQLHIGMCYEKLGKQAAQKAYQKVVESYPEQTEAVNLANEKLSLLLRADAINRKENKEFNIRKIWEGTGIVPGPISPDGIFFSYIDWETGDLGIFQIASGEMRRLTTNESEWNEFVDYSRWSPDSKQIVYNWWTEPEGIYQLRIIGIDGSTPNILFSDSNYVWVQPYDWSPDGSKILALLQKKDKTEIALITISNGSVRTVLDESENWHWTDLPSKVKFSPDGKFIVYDIREGDSPNHDIFVLPIEGGQGMPLAKHPADDYLLGWTPDGKRILFASARTGTYGLWTLRVSGGKSQGYPELITTDIGAIRSMGFTQDGAFYSQPPKGYGHDVYIAELDQVTGNVIATPEKMVKQFEGVNMTPDFSPCGKYLAYVSLRGPFFQRTSSTIGGNTLCIRSLETGKTMEFYPELYRFGFPRWSPDSRSVFLPNWDTKKNQMGIYQIDIQNGKAKPIIVTELGLLRGHALSPDSDLIFLALAHEAKKGGWKIMVKDLNSRIEKELYNVASENVYSLSISPDGQLLATLSRGITADNKGFFIRVVTTSGGELRKLHTLQGLSRHLTWTSDGKYILFNYYRDGLYRIAVEGGEPEKLFEMSGEMQNLTAHPDDRRIAFSSGSPLKDNAEVWMMENFLPALKAEQ